jgi:hypothetical protein
MRTTHFFSISLLLLLTGTAHAGAFYTYECTTPDEVGTGRNVYLIMTQSDIDAGVAKATVNIKKSGKWTPLTTEESFPVTLEWSKRKIVSVKVDLGRKGSVEAENTSNYDGNGAAQARVQFDVAGARDREPLDAECKWLEYGPKPSVSGSK